MSLMILAALAATTAPVASDATIGPKDWAKVVHSARQMNIPADTLYHAMTDVEVRRRSAREVRYCLLRDDIVPGKTGKVCRTRNQWASFGLEMPDPRG